MKILFLSHRFPHSRIAGGHRLVYERIQYLLGRGYEVGLASFTSNEPGSMLHEAAQELLDLRTVKAPHKNVLSRVGHYVTPRMPTMFLRNYSEEMMRRVGNLVEKEHYEVVIAEFSEMGQYLYCNPYLPAVRKIISCHRCLTTSFMKYVRTAGLPFLLRAKSLLQFLAIRRYEFEMYRHMDRVIVLTSQDHSELLNYAPDLYLDIVPMGVDTGYLQKEQVEEERPIVLMTGYYRDIANLDAAVWFYRYVWPRLREDNPELEFHIVGADPPRRLQRLGARDKRVTVTGRVDDLRPYRHRSQVFVCPVRLGAGARTKCLEAMASGLPVVSTSLGMAGLPAENGDNCLVADTPELMRQCVQWLLSDEQLRKKIRNNASRMIRERFSMEKSMGALEKTVRDVASL
ncbi:glycosyltransferase [Kiritimatiella glycovorans]|uniref:Sugar transferase, PEP-CTERM/EpsH1 system associated n=1 Tax=Kiritimatiella glycovorans TaxID=1307763 RepID=A0A0G3EET5_9BACT|nr:glycosyltransferase [Kiritimatiella glycovorans]AKJ63295.1 sugar transferase, PEP-CTERM/EpsH1 system associated [Kiritimatiella glycovorans]